MTHYPLSDNQIDISSLVQDGSLLRSSKSGRLSKYALISENSVSSSRSSPLTVLSFTKSLHFFSLESIGNTILASCLIKSRNSEVLEGILYPLVELAIMIPLSRSLPMILVLKVCSFISPNDVCLIWASNSFV